MINNKNMALIDTKLYTVELFEEFSEIRGIIERFSDDIGQLEDFMIVSEERIKEILKDEEKIMIINYYDEEEKEIYDQLTYSQWVDKKNRSKKRKDLLNSISCDIVNIQKILFDGGWHSEVEKYLLGNGYKKEIYIDEVQYIKDEINVVSCNDLEVSFYNGFYRLALIEQIEEKGEFTVKVSF